MNSSTITATNSCSVYPNGLLELPLYRRQYSHCKRHIQTQIIVYNTTGSDKDRCSDAANIDVKQQIPNDWRMLKNASERLPLWVALNIQRLEYTCKPICKSPWTLWYIEKCMNNISDFQKGISNCDSLIHGRAFHLSPFFISNECFRSSSVCFFRCMTDSDDSEPMQWYPQQNHISL